MRAQQYAYRKYGQEEVIELLAKTEHFQLIAEPDVGPVALRGRSEEDNARLDCDQ
jgi:hypothetical protein